MIIQTEEAEYSVGAGADGTKGFGGRLWLVVPHDESEAPFVTDSLWFRREGKKALPTHTLVNLSLLLERVGNGTSTWKDERWLRRYFRSVARR